VVVGGTVVVDALALVVDATAEVLVVVVFDESPPHAASSQAPLRTRTPRRTAM
jgi:hypothetical protein